MATIDTQMEIRDLVDNTPLRDKLLELRHWEQNSKAKEKELKMARNEAKKLQAHDGPEIRSQIRPELQNGAGGDSSRANGFGSPGEEVAENNQPSVLEDEKTKHQKMAHLEKERGNKLVGMMDYEKAIGHYTAAIELYDQEPAYYTNRAQCYLKLAKYQLAIEDCNKAFALDKTFYKAYYRRMRSYTMLEDYDLAMGDCIVMIKLDKTNAELRKEFDRLKALKLAKDKRQEDSIAAAAAAKKPTTLMWQPRPKKLWSKFGSDEEEIQFQDKAPHLRSKKPLRRVPVTEIHTVPEPVEPFPDHIVDKIFNNFTGESSSNSPPASSSYNSGGLTSPLFSSCSPLFGSFLSSPVTPSSTKSLPSAVGADIETTTTMKRTCSPERSVDDIFEGMSVKAMRPESDPELIAEQEDLSQNGTLIMHDKIDAMKPAAAEESTSSAIILQQYDIPKTGAQFHGKWQTLNTIDERAEYLRQVDDASEVMASLNAYLDSTLLSEILAVLKDGSMVKRFVVGQVLCRLSRNEGIDILAMMMTEEDQIAVKELLAYANNRNEWTAETCAAMEKLFL